MSGIIDRALLMLERLADKGQPTAEPEAPARAPSRVSGSVGRAFDALAQIEAAERAARESAK